MGQLTLNAKVWYPSTTDTAEINVLMATLASSIENGLQPRLALQEKALGLKASIPDNTFAISSTATVLPYQVTAGFSDFNNGFTLTAGVATVTVAGMYLVTATCGATTGSGTGIKIYLQKNGSVLAVAELPQSTAIWVNPQVTTVLNCVPGDTISVRGAWTAGSGSTTLRQQETNYLSIAMVQALPA